MSNNRTLEYEDKKGRRALVKAGELTIFRADGTVEIELTRGETSELLSLLYDYRAEILNGPGDAGMEESRDV